MAEKSNGFDFGGYATKYNTLCSDGRKILPNAFKHSDGAKLPLVYQHLHDDPANVLGHVILEHRDDGVYVNGKFNDTESGKNAKILVQAGDLDMLSIYANQLVEKNKIVHNGMIREVSLVLSGANPGAKIDHLNMQHADGTETEVEDEAIIYSGETLVVEKPVEKAVEKAVEKIQHADNADDRTVGDVFKTLSEEQKNVVYAIVAAALEGEGSDNLSQSDEEGETFMKKNVFEREDAGLSQEKIREFAHAVFSDLPKYGTFKESFMAHAGTYGIGSDRANLELLFPDARALDNEPGFDTRRMGWVSGWMSATRHTPFSRIKKLWGDLTAAEARAKGYITGNQKVEQVFPVLKRTTEPTTIYKKQKLDRDDIIDITDFDVVAWMWREMRFMLEEEVARAALVGDGRTFGVDDDAIDPSKIRPIYGDDPIFVHYLTLDVTVVDYADIIDAILVARVNYKGTGTPTLYTTNAVLTNMLLLKDTTDRRIYKNVAELANELRVADIVEVEVLEGVQRTNAAPAFTADLLGIMVNPRDYTYGADKGGQVATFDDFDIDYNQYKYLIETRMSGSLLEPKSALAIERKTA